MSTLFQLKDRLSDLKDQLEEIRVHNEKHMLNVTNTTNKGLDRVADALDKLNDDSMEKIVSVSFHTIQGPTYPRKP